MKTITCLDCDQLFSGETVEEVMEAMMPHYMEDHPNRMNESSEGLRDGWFFDLNERFDAAPLT
jgi:hypothetical protein